MKKFLPYLFLIFSSCSHVAFATQITFPTIWSVNDTVTNVKLNGDNNAVSAVVNGNLDNTNMASGYFLFQSVAALPAAGRQGRVDFLTSDNSLNLDSGSAWLKTITPTGTLATGDIPYYNGSWQLLAPGASNLPIVSNGISSLPSYKVLPIAGGGTGQITQQAAIDALLPSQSSNSGKFLTTNGSASSWASLSFIPNNIQVFSSNGTWTKPAGVSNVYVKVWGAGGGGVGNGGNKSGGSGGGYSEGNTAVTGNVTVTVGSGGAGDSTTGNAGGDSSFAGTTTITATGGGGGAASAGAGSNGSINLSGSIGIASGPGGSAPLGGAGGGVALVAANVQNGAAPGGGGSGTTAAAPGGSGGNGMVIVYY